MSDPSEPFLLAQDAMRKAWDAIAAGQRRQAYNALTAAIEAMEAARRALTGMGKS